MKTIQSAINELYARCGKRYTRQHIALLLRQNKLAGSQNERGDWYVSDYGFIIDYETGRIRNALTEQEANDE